MNDEYGFSTLLKEEMKGAYKEALERIRELELDSEQADTEQHNLTKSLEKERQKLDDFKDNTLAYFQDLVASTFGKKVKTKDQHGFREQISIPTKPLYDDRVRYI